MTNAAAKNEGLTKALSVARGFLQGRDFVAAERSSQEILENHPYDSTALNILALAKNGLGHRADAICLSKQAVQLAPKDAVLHVNLGRLLADDGDIKTSVEHIWKAASLLPRLTVRGDAASLPVLCGDSAINLALPVEGGTIREVASILSGEIYPLLPYPENVRTIVDVGANVGAFSALMSSHYPDARIAAFEPASIPFQFLEGNAKSFPRVDAHNVGLYSSARTATLYAGVNPMLGSLNRSRLADGDGEQVSLVDARECMATLEISTIDILKVDTEGAEVIILEALADLLPSVQVLYVEYHADADRVRIDQLMAETHVLTHGVVKRVDVGELCYVQRKLIPTAEFLSP